MFFFAHQALGGFMLNFCSLYKNFIGKMLTAWPPKTLVLRVQFGIACLDGLNLTAWMQMDKMYFCRVIGHAAQSVYFVSLFFALLMGHGIMRKRRCSSIGRASAL